MAKKRQKRISVPQNLSHYIYMSTPKPARGEDSEFSIFLTKDIDGRLSFFGEKKTSSAKEESLGFKGYEPEEFRRPMLQFCTGSRYLGLWNKLGIAGRGVYRYPHGVVYDGEFNNNGQYDGFGTLIYPNGQRLAGIWHNGKLTKDMTYVFSCGAVLDENYCQTPDRRFHVEIQREFGPEGKEILTKDPPPAREIPKGCYDVEYGFYNTKSQAIEIEKFGSLDAEQASESLLQHPHMEQRDSLVEININVDTKMEYLLRKASDLFQLNGRIIYEIPTPEYIKWIEENCRKPGDEPTGYRPDLYEYWTGGRKDFKFTKEFENELRSVRSVHIKEPPRIISFIKKADDGKSIVLFRRRSKRFASKSKNL